MCIIVKICTCMYLGYVCVCYCVWKTILKDLVLERSSCFFWVIYALDNSKLLIKIAELKEDKTLTDKLYSYKECLSLRNLDNMYYILYIR